VSFPRVADLGLQASSFARIEREICQVEESIREQIQSQVPLVSEIGCHVLEAGGKRLRPAFVILSARAASEKVADDRAYRPAACMEMIHMATLMHDDVIDNADLRRGRATANVVFGGTASILSGDVLLSKAMAILADDGDLDIIRKVSRAVVELAEGEVRELDLRNVFELSEDQYLETLRMKTASFIECCCEVGAFLAGASDHTRKCLAQYGHHIGLAFQIADDLLDYRGSDRQTGKPSGTDFREGCATLPLIYVRERLNKDEYEFVAGKFGNGASDEDLQVLYGLMNERGAFERSHELARSSVEQAKRAIAPLAPSESLDLLLTAADFVVLRNA